MPYAAAALTLVVALANVLAQQPSPAAARLRPMPDPKVSDNHRFLEVSEAKASATLRIGTVELPADGALARREHPRLLFTKADVPDIRARIAQPG